MLRPHAVHSLLVEEVASLRVDEADRDAPGYRDVLLQARKKALAFFVLCWTAIAVLVLTRVPENPGLLADFGSLYLIALLVVATAAGFRLGQWEKYRAVGRCLEELEEREEVVRS